MVRAQWWVERAARTKVDLTGCHILRFPTNFTICFKVQAIKQCLRMIYYNIDYQSRLGSPSHKPRYYTELPFWTVSDPSKDSNPDSMLPNSAAVRCLVHGTSRLTISCQRCSAEIACTTAPELLNTWPVVEFIGQNPSETSIAGAGSQIID